MDHRSSVQYLCFNACRVLKFDGRAIGRIENCFHLVAMVNDARGQPVLLLVFHSLRELVQGKAGKVVIQGLKGVVGQRCAYCLPGQRVIAHDGILRDVFDLARLCILYLKMDGRLRVRQYALQERNRAGYCQKNSESQNQHACELHYLPPTCNSLPSTTPAAMVMVALSAAGSSARAVPFLMRESTVLLPLLSVWIKVTIVPSGTGLPLQSRIRSVSTITRFPSCPATCM